MTDMNCPSCGGTFELPERLAGGTAECPRCRERVPVPGPAVISIVCPGCRVKVGFPARLAGRSTRCGQCGAVVRVPRPGEEPPPPAAAPPPDVRVPDVDQEVCSAWAWGGMFLGGFLPAGVLLVVGVLLDWHHRPDRSSLLLASALLVAGIGAGTGYLLGALTYLVRTGRPRWPVAGRGPVRGGVLLGAFALVGGLIAGMIEGFALLLEGLAVLHVGPGADPGRTLLAALSVAVFTPLVATAVGALVGAALGAALGRRGAYGAPPSPED
jgi:hypothetical protein